MTTANFAASHGATPGALRAVGQWIAVLTLGIAIGYMAFSAPQGRGLTTPTADGAAALQIEDWHGNVRRSVPSREGRQ